MTKSVSCWSAIQRQGLGAKLAQEIQPLTDLPRIERLIAETTELKRLLSPDRYLPLGGLHDLSPILREVGQGRRYPRY